MHTHKHTENVAQVCSWPQAQFLSYRIYEFGQCPDWHLKTGLPSING